MLRFATERTPSSNSAIFSFSLLSCGDGAWSNHPHIATQMLGTAMTANIGMFLAEESARCDQLANKSP
jgi:hypothetical protein